MTIVYALCILVYFRKQLPNTDTKFPSAVATFLKCRLTHSELLAMLSILSDIQSTHSVKPTILSVFDLVATFWDSILGARLDLLDGQPDSLL